MSSYFVYSKEQGCTCRYFQACRLCVNSEITQKPQAEAPCEGDAVTWGTGTLDYTNPLKPEGEVVEECKEYVPSNPGV